MHLIIGGARSGKSSTAARLAGRSSSVVFIATGLPVDEEMTRRIETHQSLRPPHWETREEPVNLDQVLEQISRESFDGAVLIDCLGFWVSNLLERNEKMDFHDLQELIMRKAENALTQIRKSSFNAIVVSNIVGMGLVPDNHLGRQFRDLLGLINQRFGEDAEEVTLMIAGLPLPIKQKGELFFGQLD